jgi:hypothetical protein
VLDAISYERCTLLINLYAKVHNFMLCCPCEPPPPCHASNVSTDEGISHKQGVPHLSGLIPCTYKGCLAK